MRRVLLATLAVGVLDLLDAVVYFGLVYDVPPIRIFHAIAAGVLGRDPRLRDRAPRGGRAPREVARRQGPPSARAAAAGRHPLGGRGPDDFALVNAFAGAARVPRRDFLVGTLLGTTPGCSCSSARRRFSGI